ncbi:MAG: PQQ-dependent sugar dehydrogenase [Kineosporiaceae bacterium]|nr:PQQ-dependent sugar dehydrogenase [Kineosporiaceae bacterium]
MRHPLAVLAALIAVPVLTAVVGCSGDDRGEVPTPRGTPTAPGSAGPPAQRSAPPLQVEVVTRGLEHGWDIGFLPDGSALVSERPGRITLVSSLRPGATTARVGADLSDVFAQGEGGLLGLVVHPDFATSRRFTTCQNHHEKGRPFDIRLVTWRLADDSRSAVRVGDLLTGLPIAAGGRHSGCRPTLAADGALLVGTGDTADGRVPQDRTSLGGKVLRLDLQTGNPLPDNPFVTSENRFERYVYSYGHRNVQGVAIRPGTGQIYTAEHGPRVNDEVNLLRAGGNHGWDPSRGGTVDGYDESVPMTDLDRFPDAVPAVWQTGDVTQALCAATFLDGPQWGELNGALVVTALKGAKLVLIHLDPAGAVRSIAIPQQTNGAFGRLRAARLGPDGALYVTTTNGADDALLRITPSAGGAP